MKARHLHCHCILEYAAYQSVDMQTLRTASKAWDERSGEPQVKCLSMR
jgi:hypothetical protein